jgi:hypothetical protein
LVALPETSVPFTQWKTEGDGKSVPQTNGFLNEGPKPFIARVVFPDNPDYRVSGSVSLPAVNAGVVLSAAADQPSVVHDKTSTSAVASLDIVRGKSGLRVGRKEVRNGSESAAWLPFSIERLAGTVRVSVAGEEQTLALPEANGVTFSLHGLAQIRDLTIFTQPKLPDRMLPLHLDSAANIRLTGAEAKDAGLQLDAATSVRGIQMVGDVPFLLSRGPELPALDIKPSMAGWRDGQYRSVTDYLRAGVPARRSTPGKELNRVLLSVPSSVYGAVHLLAFSRDGELTAPRLTLRYGYLGDAAGIFEDTVAGVPAWDGSGDGEYVVARVPVKMGNGKNGYLFHLRVPLPEMANLRGLNKGGFVLELTRDVKVRVPVPDPFEYGQIPVGPPSGVVVLAATMERTPVELEYSTAEAGNVFYDTQRVIFQNKLTNNSDKPVSGRIFINAVGPGTAQETALPQKSWSVEAKYSLKPGETKPLSLDATPDKRGWFKATIGVEADGILVQQRDTSFAVLAPDTRRAMDDSPFGVWSFWEPHTASGDPARTDKLAGLMHKGGWRWTYGGMPGGYGVAPEKVTEMLRELKEKYRLTLTIQSPPEAYQRKEGWYDAAQFQEKVVPWLADAQKRGLDNTYKVLHESRSSMALVRRFSECFGGEPYDMPADEKTKLEKQFANVKQYTEALKKADPNAKIVLINDYPAVAAEYLKRGFPGGNFDAIGLESANFMREPERQPDWLSLLGTMAQIRRMQAQYGYDKPVWLTEALYHATNPGSLDTHQQGVIYVREAMLALANGVQRMAAAGLIADSADDYYWTNWGAAGFCERDPEYNPKPSYAMYAWLTQVLDQARFAAAIKSDSTVLHVLDFQKPDKSHVYPVWTVRGRQSVTLQTQGGAPVVYDVYGNRLDVPVRNGRIVLDVTDTPQYVTGTTVTAVAERKPVEVPREAGQAVTEFDDATQWKVVGGPSEVLKTNWSTPFIQGDFATSFVQEDGASTLRLELKDDSDARKLLPRYIQLALAQPIELKGRPSALTVRLKGNGGWGRVMFELVDGAGRIWTSSGNQLPGATNAADSEGVSFVSFDGWQTIAMPLPGQYSSPDQFVHWPRNFDWWPTGPVVDKELAARIAAATAANVPKMPIADGHDVVTYPLKLTKIIVTMRPHILYVNDEVPIGNRVIYLDKIGVIEAAPGM